MKKILLFLLFLSGTIVAQENDKSLVIIGGPTDLWTNNRGTAKDEFNAFTNLGVQFSKRKTASMDVVYTGLTGFWIPITAFVVGTILAPQFQAIQTNEGEKLFMKWLFLKGVREIK